MSHFKALCQSFLCYGLGTARQAILLWDRSCYSWMTQDRLTYLWWFWENIPLFYNQINTIFPRMLHKCIIVKTGYLLTFSLLKMSLRIYKQCRLRSDCSRQGRSNIRLCLSLTKVCAVCHFVSPGASRKLDRDTAFLVELVALVLMVSSCEFELALLVV